MTNPLEYKILNGVLVKLDEFKVVEKEEDHSSIYVPVLQAGLSDGGRPVTDIDEFRSRWATSATVLQVSEGITSVKKGDSVIVSRNGIIPRNYYYDTIEANQIFKGYLILNPTNIISKK